MPGSSRCPKQIWMRLCLHPNDSVAGKVSFGEKNQLVQLR